MIAHHFFLDNSLRFRAPELIGLEKALVEAHFFLHHFAHESERQGRWVASLEGMCDRATDTSGDGSVESFVACHDCSVYRVREFMEGGIVTRYRDMRRLVKAEVRLQ